MKRFSEFAEEVKQVNESRMSEVHASITNHLDKHIASFKKGKLGMDQFGVKVLDAHKKVAKEHGIDTKHAAKLVNDYVDSALNESVELNEDTAYHRVAVTVSDPNHPAVTQRKEQHQKFVRVKGDKEDAVDRAKSHFKKKGYKVHDAEYVEGYDKSVNEELDEAHDPLRAAARRISKKLTPPKPADIVNFEKSVASIRKSYKNFKVPSQPTHTNEEVGLIDELDEAVKLNSTVTIHAPGKSYHGKTGTIGEIRHGLYKGAPKIYTVDYDHDESTGHSKSIQLGKENVKLCKEEVDQIDEISFPSEEILHEISTELAGKVLAARQKKLEKMRDEKGSIAATKTPEYKHELGKAQKTGAIVSKRRTAEIHKKVAAMTPDDWDKLNKGYAADADENRKRGHSND